MDLEGTKTGGDGLIQFTEFLVAGCDKHTLLSVENIRKEFLYLDHDKDGFINTHDIEKFMYGLADAGSVRDDMTDFTKLLQEIKETHVTGEIENSYKGSVIDF